MLKGKEVNETLTRKQRNDAQINTSNVLYRQIDDIRAGHCQVPDHLLFEWWPVVSIPNNESFYIFRPGSFILQSAERY